MAGDAVTVHPVSHATAWIKWGDEIIYTDPIGRASAFEGVPKPTLILLTDVHGDHLSTSTLDAVIGSAALIVPKAVGDMLPANLSSRAKVLANGEKIEQNGFSIEAIPMYNIPEKKDAFHTKGRGNGYVIERGDEIIYTDPVGRASAFEGVPKPTLILLTDVHGDHLSTSTLDAVIGSAALIVPKAVGDMLPANLSSR